MCDIYTLGDGEDDKQSPLQTRVKVPVFTLQTIFKQGGSADTIPSADESISRLPVARDILSRLVKTIDEEVRAERKTWQRPSSIPESRRRRIRREAPLEKPPILPDTPVISGLHEHFVDAHEIDTREKPVQMITFTKEQLHRMNIESPISFNNIMMTSDIPRREAIPLPPEYSGKQ